MAAERVILLIILLVCATVFMIIGLVQYKSKEPVGFWTGKKPPRTEQITDVKAYNQKHGLMWIIFGTGMIVCYVCGLFWGGAAAGWLCMVEVAGGILLMIFWHGRLEHMYCKKEGGNEWKKG